MNVLIIGCGNIGALYDVTGKDINTHIKAYAAIPGTEIDIYDTNKENLARAQQYFACNIVDQIDYQKYRCISICTPTPSHAGFLLNALRNNVPVIICEKPLSNDVEELERIREACHLSDSLLHVNYIRRYQPEFARLKDYIAGEKIKGNPVTNVTIQYQRGLINNASHAFDLLLFFLGDLHFSQVKISGAYTEFENDPNISFSCTLNDDIRCQVTGLENINYSFFGMQVFLSNSCILVEENGNAFSILEMDVKESPDPDMKKAYKANPQKKDSRNDVLHDYMQHVMKAALDPDYIPEDVERTINMTKSLIEISNRHDEAGN